MEEGSTVHLDTPYGAFKIKVNGKEAAFSYNDQEYACISQGPVHVYCMKCDISKLVIGDVITCTFEHAGHILHLEGYKPLPIDKTRQRVYHLEKNEIGFRYEIVTAPHPDSRLTLTVGWLGHPGTEPSVFVIAV